MWEPGRRVRPATPEGHLDVICLALVFLMSDEGPEKRGERKHTQILSLVTLAILQ